MESSREERLDAYEAQAIAGGIPEDQAVLIRDLVSRIGTIGRPMGGTQLGIGWVPQRDENGVEVPPEDMVPPIEWWAAMHLPSHRGTQKLKTNGDSPEDALVKLTARLIEHRETLDAHPAGKKKKRRGWLRGK